MGSETQVSVRIGETHLVCTFRVANTNLGASDVAGVLKAKTKAGANVVGTDALTAVAKKKGETDQDCDDDDDEWSDRDDH